MTHDEHHHSHEHPPARRGMQRHHLLMIVGVVLMLLAMAGYILSLDESIDPEGDGEPVPAMAPAE